MKRALTILSILFGVVAVLVLTAFFYYLGVTKDVNLIHAKLTLETDQSIFIDVYGKEITNTGHREAVSFREFPSHLPLAFVAVEDKRFFAHDGFDFRRIVKAMLKNASTLSFREGASTISQQLIKNTHLTNEKTITRKLKEFKLTRQLEKKYSKEEILELYLNSIYFGHSAFGIGDAAYFYFGKTPSELLPEESALLASLVKSPNRYSPFKNPEKCKVRRDFVLNLMKEQGIISDIVFQKSVKTALPTQPHCIENENFYLSLVKEELANLLPDAQTGTFGKMRVYTAYDPLLQQKLEEIQIEKCDTTLLVQDNQSNMLKAMRATAGLLKRLPASTIKPLLVYAPAMEENLISPATPILDKKTDFGGYSPNDAGGASNQYISVRHALAKSVNIPAVKILNTIGIEKGVGYMKKMGLEVDREDYSLALALGGMREGFSLEQLADGYATFANDGNYAPSSTILRIEDEKGKKIYEQKTHKTRVFSKETCFLVNDMLQTATQEGTARKLKSLPFQVCAKTGTHESGNENLDAYTIAYTTKDTVAVWLGNADNSPIPATGGGLPANYAKFILEYLYKEKKPQNFTMPEGITRMDFDRETYETEHKIIRTDPLSPLPDSITDYFKTDNLPTETCTRFSHPTIKKPQIFAENNSVKIVLFQTEYFEYIIKRENRGKTVTIYSGKYKNMICDNSVMEGEEYVYTVIPVYRGNEGEAQVLPRVKITATNQVPDHWWIN